MLLLKVILMPPIVGGATLASRRWGSGVGGWLLGMPWVSGPVSMFLLVERGRPFAAQAAHGTLLGMAALVAFCVAYDRGARRSGWPVASTLAVGAYLLAALALSLASVGLVPSALLVVTAVVVARAAMGVPPADAPRVAPPAWDLPLRMASATALVILITGAAEALGPVWTGVLVPFPMVTWVMAVFSHRLVGPEAPRGLLRGVLAGALTTAAFQLVVGLTVESVAPVLAYGLAVLAALTMSRLSLATLVARPQPARAGIDQF